MGSGIEHLTDLYSLWNLHRYSRASSLQPWFLPIRNCSCIRASSVATEPTEFSTQSYWYNLICIFPLLSSPQEDLSGNLSGAAINKPWIACLGRERKSTLIQYLPQYTKCVLRVLLFPGSIARARYWNWEEPCRVFPGTSPIPVSTLLVYRKALASSALPEFQKTNLFREVKKFKEVLVVKNSPVSAGDTRDTSLVLPGLGGSPGGGHGNPFSPGESHGQRNLVGYSP